MYTGYTGMGDDREILTVRISAAGLARIRERAERTGQSVSDTARAMLQFADRYMDRPEVFGAGRKVGVTALGRRRGPVPKGR
jgi:hypothetical protein